MDELVLRLYLDGIVLFLLFGRLCSRARYQSVQPLPAVHVDFADNLLNFGGFKTHTFGYDKAHSAADDVRLNPLEVSVTRDLDLLGGLSVDADWAVSDDVAQIVVRRQIL